MSARIEFKVSKPGAESATLDATYVGDGRFKVVLESGTLPRKESLMTTKQVVKMLEWACAAVSD